VPETSVWVPDLKEYRQVLSDLSSQRTRRLREGREEGLNAEALRLRGEDLTAKDAKDAKNDERQRLPTGRQE
jgi:hypothetical protein